MSNIPPNISNTYKAAFFFFFFPKSHWPCWKLAVVRTSLFNKALIPLHFWNILIESKLTCMSFPSTNLSSTIWNKKKKKKKSALPFAAAWTQLEILLLSEVSQKENNSGFRTGLVSVRMQVQSLALISGLRLGNATSCRVDCRCGSDLAWLWLWCKLWFDP